jgi:hypothetical protein
MRIQRSFVIWFSLLLPQVFLMANYIRAQAQHRDSKKYVCSELHPESSCNAGGTYGSSSGPCTVDIKRRGSNSASATPSISNAKPNTPFCVKVGTTVDWKSTSKDTGFVLDFGGSSPFDTPGAIIGGSDRPVSVVAKRVGCFKYSAGACTSGAIYGMCGSADSEIVVTGGTN